MNFIIKHMFRETEFIRSLVCVAQPSEEKAESVGSFSYEPTVEILASVTQTQRHGSAALRQKRQCSALFREHPLFDGVSHRLALPVQHLALPFLFIFF